MADAKSNSVTSSGKRKRTAKITYYAVKQGHTPDIYYSWADVQKQITGHKTPMHESFSTLAEAEAFMRTGRSNKAKPQKQEFFYAVHTDRIDGVFTDWPSAAAAMKGHKGIKQQKFKTAEEAWAHLGRIKTGTPSDASAPISIKSETLKGASKKLKKNDGSAAAAPSTVFGGSYEPGTGPLPTGAQDGFDDTIFFNPDTGKVEHKTDAQRNARTMQHTGEISGPIEIYTDGSSLGNGKVGAVAGLGVWFGHDDPRNLSEPLRTGRQTNQRAELMAISRALDIAPIDKDVVIYSDSNYSIKCVTEWFISWVRKGWKNSAGKAVENQDIIKPIIERINERKLAKADTKFIWLKGHANHEGNVMADREAVKASKKAQLDIASGELVLNAPSELVALNGATQAKQDQGLIAGQQTWRDGLEAAAANEEDPDWRAMKEAKAELSAARGSDTPGP